MSWLPFPSLVLEPLPQLYRREGERTYRYESSGGRFVRMLEVNRVGFVVKYPELWLAEANQQGELAQDKEEGLPASPIRLALAADLELVASLMGEFYAESGYPLDRELASAALLELIDDPDVGRLWLILDSEEQVGYIAVTFGFSLEYYGRDAFIDDLFIRPPFRGVGLGTCVLEAVERECRALGVRALHLEVGRTNHAGQALYRRQGFRDRDLQLLSKPLGAMNRSGP